MASIYPFKSRWRAEIAKNGRRLSKVVDSEDEAKLWVQHALAALDASKKRYEPREQLVSLGPDLVTMVPRMVLDAARMVPHKQIDILEAAIPTSRASGVYFLIRDREVVYVGQSVDVLHRIARHRREGRKFDAFSYIECEPDQMDRLEGLYIRAFVPEGNLSFGKLRGSSAAC